jgi:8-amino-7-oxononanoate synthase
LNKLEFIDKELDRRREKHQFRKLKSITPLSATDVSINGQRIINFSSNDYLGLSKHPLLKERSIEFANRYGTGSTASRLICGSFDCFDQVEEKLAALKGTEASLILNSGFQANTSVIATLLDPDAIVFSDELNHSSIIQGVVLSRARKVIYPHNDLAQLRKRLEQTRGDSARKLIVTESVFSMDGDRSDIDSLIALAKEHDALLMVDEAHATGVLGKNGMGMTADKDVDIVLGTFGKALGAFGAYICCSEKMRDYLINCCPGFIYSTALPPSIVGSIDAALDLAPQMESARQHLQSTAEYFRQKLRLLGYDTGASSTQIVPIIVGDEQQTLTLAEKLQESGFLATAIRPPTVPEGTSRIRVALSSEHDRSQVDGLLSVFEEYKGSSPHVT